MNRNAVIKFLGVLTCVAFSVCAVSIGVSGDMKPAVKQRIQEIDKEIAKRNASIKQNQRLEKLWGWKKTDYMSKMKASARGSFGAGSNHDGPTGQGTGGFKDAGLEYYDDLIGSVKPANERERRRIDQLEYEKRELLNQQKSACFPSETRVLTGKGILKPIEQIKPGDMVMTFDIGAQADIPKPVLNTYKNDNNHHYVINDAVKVTALERFLTPDGWREVLNLKPGDKIHTSQGLETIHSLVVQYGPLEVHNLHVEGSHTFYVVGEDEKLYLVHNTGGGGGDGGGGK